MDEQTNQLSPQQSQSAYDVSADGAAYSGYEEEPLPPAPEEEPAPAEPELAPDGIGLSDGEIQLGDEFFGNMKDDTPEPSQPAPEPEAPKWYTDDELKATPFEQWDLARLNGDIGRFAPIVQEQLKQRNVQRNAQQSAQAIQNIPMPIEMTEPKPYTPKELSDESLKLACEKLGLKDPEDFDGYELEHNAALTIAREELLAKRTAEVSGYKQAVAEWQDNLKFQADLVRLPDFNDFNQWYIGKCRESGVTPEQVNEGLIRRATQNGNRFGMIPQIIRGWYQEYRQEKIASQPKPAPTAPARGIRRVGGNPPVLEGTRGNNYGYTQRVTPRDFGHMTPDEQAEALIKMGYV